MLFFLKKTFINPSIISRSFEISFILRCSEHDQWRFLAQRKGSPTMCRDGSELHGFYCVHIFNAMNVKKGICVNN